MTNRGYIAGFTDGLLGRKSSNPYSWDKPVSTMNYSKGYFIGCKRRKDDGVTLLVGDGTMIAPISPVIGICQRMKLPRKQHAMVCLEHTIFTVVTADQQHFPFAQDGAAAFKFAQSVKKGFLV